jgi:hypothetical protein
LLGTEAERSSTPVPLAERWNEVEDGGFNALDLPRLRAIDEEHQGQADEADDDNPGHEGPHAPASGGVTAQHVIPLFDSRRLAPDLHSSCRRLARH